MSPTTPPADPSPLLDSREIPLSPWVRLVKRTILVPGIAEPQVYHSFAQSDYVVILAKLNDGRFPIVRQYRAAVDAYTWEFPAGLVDGSEAPEETCRRELLEETGITAEVVTPLGSYYPDTGRLGNRIHVFFARGSAPRADFTTEPGMELTFVSLNELHERVRAGTFRHQLHLAALAIAPIAGVSLAD